MKARNEESGENGSTSVNEAVKDTEMVNTTAADNTGAL